MSSCSSHMSHNALPPAHSPFILLYVQYLVHSNALTDRNRSECRRPRVEGGGKNIRSKGKEKKSPHFDDRHTRRKGKNRNTFDAARFKQSPAFFALIKNPFLFHRET
ncbi:hypothetical protein CgunFtcFv8_003721 [Champsocephalus gunnari]|uniref:Uncharacterized protein n=1 Tax=Champsocephalus gunnari TaxID=52237 RepID=A0AAN8E5I8_CHAGU|nr:hypothetical protein CgunFtcFv8_003721 [Champsocephalus gunnari]